MLSGVTLANAVGNVCFTPKEVSAEEMARLRVDVERKNRQPVTFDTFAWLWSRLGQTGPHGNEYITRMQPMWKEVEESYVESGRNQSLRPGLVLNRRGIRCGGLAETPAACRPLESVSSAIDFSVQ